VQSCRYYSRLDRLESKTRNEDGASFSDMGGKKNLAWAAAGVECRQFNVQRRIRVESNSPAIPSQ